MRGYGNGFLNNILSHDQCASSLPPSFSIIRVLSGSLLHHLCRCQGSGRKAISDIDSCMADWVRSSEHIFFSFSSAPLSLLMIIVTGRVRMSSMFLTLARLFEFKGPSISDRSTVVSIPFFSTNIQ